MGMHMNDPLKFFYESTPAIWACYYDPEGPVGRSKSKTGALGDLIDQCDDDHRGALLLGAIVAAIEGDARVVAHPPSGWKLVPIEPTSEQFAAAQAAWNRLPNMPASATMWWTLYKAMLEAAGSPSEVGMREALNTARNVLEAEAGGLHVQADVEQAINKIDITLARAIKNVRPIVERERAAERPTVETMSMVLNAVQVRYSEILVAAREVGKEPMPSPAMMCLYDAIYGAEPVFAKLAAIEPPGVARSDAREDMANVGEAFMARLPKDFHWNECPTEYVIRLLDDAEELANALRDVLAGHPVRNADELIQRYSPLPIEPSGVPRP